MQWVHLVQRSASQTTPSPSCNQSVGLHIIGSSVKKADAVSHDQCRPSQRVR